MDKAATTEAVEGVLVENELVTTQRSVAEQLVIANKYLESVKQYTIDSPLMFDIAAAELTTIRELEKALEQKRDDIVRPMNTRVKEVNALFKKPAAILAEAKAVIGPKMIAFEKAQNAEREAREKAAEIERNKAQAEADALVQKALDSGDAAAVEEAMINQSMASMGPSLVSAADPLNRGGHAKLVRYNATVVDLPALLDHIAASLRRGEETFNNTVDIKVGQLNTFGNATKGSVPIPGVRFDREEKMSARTGGF